MLLVNGRLSMWLAEVGIDLFLLAIVIIHCSQITRVVLAAIHFSI